jgi:hypothetical protein
MEDKPPRRAGPIRLVVSCSRLSLHEALPGPRGCILLVLLWLVLVLGQPAIGWGGVLPIAVAGGLATRLPDMHVHRPVRPEAPNH